MGLFDLFKIPPAIAGLRGQGFILVQNNLCSNLCQMHDEFICRADMPPLARSMIAGPIPVIVPSLGRLAS